uniref:Upstream stimulatory factor 2 n=1 Tax=Ornithorhynchus anatinus TaxID=9258 RepID=A0A6I8N5B7_ORNAN
MSEVTSLHETESRPHSRPRPLSPLRDTDEDRGWGAGGRGREPAWERGAGRPRGRAHSLDALDDLDLRPGSAESEGRRRPARGRAQEGAYAPRSHSRDDLRFIQEAEPRGDRPRPHHDPYSYQHPRARSREPHYDGQHLEEALRRKGDRDRRRPRRGEQEEDDEVEDEDPAAAFPPPPPPYCETESQSSRERRLKVRGGSRVGGACARTRRRVRARKPRGTEVGSGAVPGPEGLPVWGGGGRVTHTLKAGPRRWDESGRPDPHPSVADGSFPPPDPDAESRESRGVSRASAADFCPFSKWGGGRGETILIKFADLTLSILRLGWPRGRGGRAARESAHDAASWAAGEAQPASYSWGGGGAREGDFGGRRFPRPHRAEPEPSRPAAAAAAAAAGRARDVRGPGSSLSRACARSRGFSREASHSPRPPWARMRPSPLPPPIQQLLGPATPTSPLPAPSPLPGPVCVGGGGRGGFLPRAPERAGAARARAQSAVGGGARAPESSRARARPRPRPPRVGPGLAPRSLRARSFSKREKKKKKGRKEKIESGGGGGGGGGSSSSSSAIRRRAEAEAPPERDGDGDGGEREEAGRRRPAIGPRDPAPERAEARAHRAGEREREERAVRARGPGAAARGAGEQGSGGGGGGGSSGEEEGGGGGGGGISPSHDPSVCPRDQRERLPRLLRPLLPRGLSGGPGPRAPRPPPAPRPPRSPPPLPRPSPRARAPPAPAPPMDMLDPGLDPAASATVAAAAASHEKGPEAEEGVELQEAGEGPGPEEQTAVAIASVQQTAFADHNIQYQFRTENNGGQVKEGRGRRWGGRGAGVQGLGGQEGGPAGLTPTPARRPRPPSLTHCALPPAGDVSRGPGDGRSAGRAGGCHGGGQRGLHGGVYRGGSRPWLRWVRRARGPQSSPLPIPTPPPHPPPPSPFPVSRPSFRIRSAMGAVLQLRPSVERPGLRTSRRPVWLTPRPCRCRPRTRTCRPEVGAEGPGGGSWGPGGGGQGQGLREDLTRLPSGQFYVMMTPQDVLQTGTQRTIAPRTHPYSPKMDGTRTPRDERRRAQHNEVERRRRDKINNWIVQLSKIIPDCNTDNSKTGASKGGILSKACDYIRELRQTSQRLQDTFKEAERLQVDNDLLRQQIEELKNENSLLRAQLQQHGLDIVGETPRQ